MNLRRLTIRNFRPYYGETVLEFGDILAGPITLIHGPNGYGKTSILLALQWCLYGTKRKREAFEYLNTRARNEPDPVMEVRAEFVGGDRTYEIVRRIKNRGLVQTASDLSTDELIFLEDGQRDQVQDPLVLQERIDELLPKNASQFAFFDGEKIEVYSEDGASEATKEAIAVVLGLHLFRQSKDDAEKLAYEIGQERQRLLGREREHTNLARESQELDRDVQSARSQLEERKGELARQKSLEADLQEQLASHEGAQHLLHEIERMRIRSEELQSSLRALAGQIQESAARVYLDILKPLVVEQAARWRALADEESRGAQEAARVEALRQLLLQIEQEQVCVCGRAIDPEHIQHIVDKLGMSPTDMAVDETSNGLEARAVERALHAAIDSTAGHQNYASLIAKHGQLENDLDEVATAIAAAETKLEGADEETIQSLTDAIARCRTVQEQRAREIGDLEGRIMDLVSCREKTETIIRRLGGQIAGLDQLTQEVDVLDATARAFDDIIRETSLTRRREIEETSTDFFKRITNKALGYNRMVIADDFSFGIETVDGSRPHMPFISAGEKQVTALSFILGLSQFSQHEAPILMDTPMSRLDEAHRQNIASVLVELDRQVILLVVGTDLAFGVKEILAPAVGCEFEIVHDQTTLVSTIQRMTP